MQGKLEYVERGIAAMPFFSLINHSCDPNILLHSRPNHIVMYATYPIRKGKQVLNCLYCINYCIV